MLINHNKISLDLFGEPDIKCPFWPDVAKNITMLLDTLPPFNFDSMEDFQKRLIVEYWHHYDGLDKGLAGYRDISSWVSFRQWFIQSATAPEKIRRASQWLIQQEYILLRPAVRGKALETASKAREAIGKFNAGKGETL